VIRDKQTMYDLLAAGRLGNTIPGWFDIDSWEASKDFHRFAYWGVRTKVPGGPCRLYCPRDEVRPTATSPEFAAAGVNISIMIDAVAAVTLWGEVYDSPEGLLVYGIEYPPRGASWRALMPGQGRHWEGVAARLLLKKHLNPNSYADLEDMLERYPGHVYEFSATEEEIGIMPGRNAVVWEVRLY
jgi:hypothetical protein